MELLPHGNHVDEFVLSLLRTGVMLSDLASNLIDALPPNAYPGEDPAQVVIEMMRGTIATAVASADPRDVERATELIELASARTLEHLRLACELRRRMHDDDEGVGRSYG